MTEPSPLGEMIDIVLGLADRGAARYSRRVIAIVVKVSAAVLIATVCAVAAIFCLLDWVWIVTEASYGPAAAPLVVAAILLVICLGLVLVLRQILNAADDPPAGQKSARTRFLAEAAQLLKDHKGSALLTALVAGLIAGASED